MAGSLGDGNSRLKAASLEKMKIKIHNDMKTNNKISTVAVPYLFFFVTEAHSPVVESPSRFLFITIIFVY